MESLGLSQKDEQLGINGEEELRGQPANPGSPGKWPLKRSVCFAVSVMQTTWRERNQQKRLKSAKEALDKNTEYLLTVIPFVVQCNFHYKNKNEN